jgi:hypothetical protein
MMGDFTVSEGHGYPLVLHKSKEPINTGFQFPDEEASQGDEHPWADLDLIESIISRNSYNCSQ